VRILPHVEVYCLIAVSHASFAAHAPQVYVTTGAPLPPGAGKVVRIEDTRRVLRPASVFSGDGGAMSHAPAADEIQVLVAAPPHEGVRHAGSDVTRGQELLPAGHLVTAFDVALLLSAGVTAVQARTAPRVAILSTGDELADAFEHAALSAGSAPAAARGACFDSNRPMLAALVTQAGGIPVDHGIVRDEPAAVEAALIKAVREANIVVTTGAVSMGDRDHVKPTLERLGTVVFGRLNMKPGKPTTLAVCRASDGRLVPVLALPGNPVSAAAGAALLLCPAVRHARGQQWAQCLPPMVRVQTMDVIHLDPERPEFHRATLWTDNSTGAWFARSTGAQASSRLLSCASANGLLSLPAGSGSLPVGTSVDAFLVGEVLNKGMLPDSVVDRTRITTVRSGCGCSSGEFAGASVAAAATGDARVAHAEIGHAGTASQRRQALRVCVLTVSDRCAAGKAEDKSGPAACKYLTNDVPGLDVTIVEMAVVADELIDIQCTLRRWVDVLAVDLVVTTGGTGFTSRDITPEATRPLLDRPAPGLVHAIIAAGLGHTPMAILARPEAGIRARTLIINLPGSPKAVVEGLAALRVVLPHALALLQQ
jgi:gephyrin